MTYIYYLQDPRNNEVKYVGATKNPKTRYKQHIKKLDKTPTPKKRWLISLFALGLNPKMKIVDKSDNERDARELEQHHLDINYTTALNIHNPRKGAKSKSREDIK